MSGSKGYVRNAELKDNFKMKASFCKRLANHGFKWVEEIQGRMETHRSKCRTLDQKCAEVIIDSYSTF
ncbi:unnamed protein product [Peronospora belbahrii]|uniref:Uncharacterized protein n=1 Tax=Peronospora belbahrii TaxID=622444 RepID=A0AAU9KNS6_9STRA|nr:unnamed protein product [Peronospora belbahrii]CAH0516218.1 unnamed protein product [Peronospora belbahrii]